MPDRLLETVSPSGKCAHTVDSLSVFNWTFSGMGILSDDMFEKFYESFLDGSVRWGSYFEHLEEILAEIPGKSNILILRYEDMKKETPATLRKVLEFSDILHLPGLEDGSLFHRVLQNTSVASMQQNQERWLLHEGQWKREDFTFVRQGKAKNWRSFLSDSQSDRIDKKFHDTFDGTTVEHWWDTEMKK